MMKNLKNLTQKCKVFLVIVILPAEDICFNPFFFSLLCILYHTKGIHKICM